jgi:xanthine/CO dehydrogenase XdhC/CoxF family maturation factor
MTDLERILPLWRKLEANGEDYVLATVVEVQGSSYRRPGACMLLTADGRHTGTVSGGCLEAEIARRAWWHTEHGPTIQRYSTAEEDGDLPYGSGCGGVIFVLLERSSTARPLLSALERAYELRIPIAVATVLEGEQIGHREFAGLPPGTSDLDSEAWEATQLSKHAHCALQALADDSYERGTSMERGVSMGETETRAWANFRRARPGLWIFGAGDDAQPLLLLAKELSWFVAVSDGRSHLASRERFPQADELHVLPIKELSAGQAACPPFTRLRPTDAGVLMTHSFEQDATVIAFLLARESPLAYIGVLGPQRRTRELLAQAARLLNLPASVIQAERWLAQLHAPTGLDLGAESPETIALSVLAEIQQCLTAATALPLRQVRAVPLATSG